MKNESLKTKMPKPLSKKAQKAADILALKASAHEAEMRVAAQIDGRLASLELQKAAGEERLKLWTGAVEQRLDALEKRPAQQGKQGDTGATGPQGKKGGFSLMGGE